MLGELLRAILGKPARSAPSHYEVRGIPVVVNNTRPDIDTADVLARLDRTLALIELCVPHHFRRAEIEFGLLMPNGERVVERAQWTVDQSDEDVAPVIDPNLAAQRIAEVDRAALRNRA